ncbi:MAG: hypothetical protein ACO3NZ_13810 [Pirellulales bacterium]
MISSFDRDDDFENDFDDDRDDDDRDGSSNDDPLDSDLDGGYRFDLVNGEVVNLQEFDDGRWKNERIDRNESWTFNGTNLIQEEAKRSGTEVTTYSDPNGDGIFTQLSEVFNPKSAALFVADL